MRCWISIHTALEVWADGDRGAYPINTLAILAFPPGQVRAHGCPEEQEHDQKDTAERRSLREPRGVVHIRLNSELIGLEH